MNKTNLFLFLFAFLLYSCQSEDEKIITVSGEISPAQMGKTLHHEHVLVDFIGADSTGYHRWDKEEVVERILPLLLEIKALGYETLVECTPEYLGRDPELLQMLSQKSGIQLITNVGYYSAYGAKFLPAHCFEESAQQLADRWIEQAQNGIEGTGVYPGFIKIAVERAPLKAINRKIVEAACITHKATGLTIMSHTGLAVPAFEQLEILEKNGIHPSAFIWTHANNEKDFSKQLEAAQQGAWIAFDKLTPKTTEKFADFALLMKENDLLHRLLFSHDSGWFKPEQANGGKINGFTAIDEFLIPALQEKGLTPQEIDQIFISNTAECFRVRKRLLQ